MKIIVFYGYLFLILLCGGQSLYAGTHLRSISSHTHRNLPKKQHVKITDTNQNNSLIEDSEIDLEEDHLGDHDVQDCTNNHFLAHGDYFSEKWYITFSPPVSLNYNHNNFISNPPFCGNSSPLYITQRVLRI